MYTQSCKNSDYIDDSNCIDDITCQTDNQLVIFNEANEIATNLNKSSIVLNSVEKGMLKSTKYIGKRQVRDNLILSDNSQPYFYVFNYNSGGYSIVSADKRLLPILAYVDNGYFNKDSLPNGLINWLENTAQIITELRKTNASQSTAVAQEWTAMSCPPEALKSSSSCPNSAPVIYTVGPLLKTAWDQGCGYNANCPLASDGPCGHAYAGCVATSMAQVMSFWKYPATYNWAQMPTNNSSAETARLMADIGNSVGMSYSGTGSGAYSSQISGSLIGTFHYKTATYTSKYNYQTVKLNLGSGWPVILGGCNDQSTILGIPYKTESCHSWVCDGYQLTHYTTIDYLFFHMNWGWGQSYNNYNGWYAFNDWALANGRNYQYGLKMVYNIHP